MANTVEIVLQGRNASAAAFAEFRAELSRTAQQAKGTPLETPVKATGLDKVKADLAGLPKGAPVTLPVNADTRRARARIAELERQIAALTGRKVTLGGLDTTAATGGLARLRGAFGGAQQGATGLAGAISGKLVGALGALGAGMTAAKIGQLTAQLGQLGAQAIVTERSFGSVTRSIGTTPALLNQLRASAGGTITDLRLMQLTNTALAGATDELGQAFADALPKLIEGARAANQLNPALGDTEFLFQSLVTGIKRGSPMLIDNTGITLKLGEANEQYAKSLGKTVEQLTESEQKQALLNATLAGVDRLVAQAGGGLDSIASRTAQFETAVGNLRAEMGKLVAEPYAIVVELATEQVEEALQTIPAMFEQLGALNVGDWYKDAFDQLAGGREITFGVAEAVSEVGRQIALGGATLDGFAGNLSATFQLGQRIVGGFGTFFSGIFAVAADQFNNFMDAVGAGFARVGALMRLDFAGANAYAQQAQRSLMLVKTGFAGYGGAVRQAGLEWSAAMEDYDATLAQIQTRYETLRMAAQNAFTGPRSPEEMSPVDEFRLDRFSGGDNETVRTGASDAETAWTNAGQKSAGAWKDEYGEFIRNFIADATQKAQGFAKGLLDLTGGANGLELNAPGANGAFENIFRALDVAKLGDKSPWAAQLGLTQEEAQKIGADFQQGLFSEGVMGLIDVDALVNQAKLAELADKSKAAFVAAIAQKAGVGQTVVGALFGFEGAGGSGKQGNATQAQQAVDSAMSQVAGVLGETVKGKDFARRIIGYGENIWGYFEKGIVDQAERSSALQQAISKMVAAAIGGQTGGSVSGAARAGGVN